MCCSWAACAPRMRVRLPLAPCLPEPERPLPLASALPLPHALSLLPLPGGCGRLSLCVPALLCADVAGCIAPVT
jgi:hypothetical protein